MIPYPVMNLHDFLKILFLHTDLFFPYFDLSGEHRLSIRKNGTDFRTHQLGYKLCCKRF